MGLPSIQKGPKRSDGFKKVQQHLKSTAKIKKIGGSAKKGKKFLIKNEMDMEKETIESLIVNNHLGK